MSQDAAYARYVTDTGSGSPLPPPTFGTYLSASADLGFNGITGPHWYSRTGTAAAWQALLLNNHGAVVSGE
jgi:hypothetical protein